VDDFGEMGMVSVRCVWFLWMDIRRFWSVMLYVAVFHEVRTSTLAMRSTSSECSPSSPFLRQQGLAHMIGRQTIPQTESLVPGYHKFC